MGGGALCEVEVRLETAASLRSFVKTGGVCVRASDQAPPNGCYGRLKISSNMHERVEAAQEVCL